MIWFYLFLRFINVLLCGQLIGWSIDHNQVWFLLLVLPCYFYGSVVSISICHLMGYHPKPELREIGAGSRKIFLPIFQKTTPSYAAIFASRHRGYQFLYESLRVILWSLLWPASLLLVALGMSVSSDVFIFLLFSLVSFFMCMFLVKQLNANFPKWFGLEVILVERMANF